MPNHGPPAVTSWTDWKGEARNKDDINKFY